MSAIELWLREPAPQAIAWALLQFVWQGTLIAVLTAGALAALKRSAADVRYVVATIALSLMLTMPVVTAVQSWRASGAHAPHAAVPAAAAGAAEQPAGSAADVFRDDEPAVGAERPLLGAAIVDGTPLDRDTLDAWLPILLLGWLVGVSLLTLRLMSGWLWMQRLKSHGTAPDAVWQRIASRLCRRLHITRGVRLLESSLVDVPTVIGWMKPVVLMPGSVLAGLSPEQLEAILAHELAHVRRHDYLVNLTQTLVETLLFYHPAVWWLSHRIRAERENCCDDLAVSLCGDPYTYAQALADLEERRGIGTPLAMAATGGSLLQRVRRLLAPTSHAGRGPGWLAATAALVVLGGVVGGTLGRDIIRAEQASTAAVTAAPQAPAVVAPATPQPPSTISPRRPPATVPAIAPATPTPPPVAPASAVTAPAIAPHAPEIATTPVAAPSATPVLRGAEVPGAVAPLIAPSAPAVVPAAPAPQGQDTVGNFTYSHNGEKLQVNYRGDIEFTADDTDVQRLSPGGYLKITDGDGRTVEFRANASGQIERRYWSGTSERPFEPEGRQWLAQVLPRFIRQTGIGAPARVARILKTGGASAVLAEIGRVQGSWAKRIYFRELVNQATLDASTARQVLVQAGREIDSDFELASLLIDAADKLLLDEAARKAYFEAARRIESDFEMRRVYASALKRGPVGASLLAGLLDASRAIGSDFELASLLMQVAKLQPLDLTTRGPFFAALATVESDFEHRRVLSTLAARPDLSPEIATAIVESAGTLDSDFELAALLTAIVKDHGVEGALRAPFFRAVDSIGSPFERGRVLQMLARRADVSPETVLAVLAAVPGMRSSYEASQVLMAVAGGRTLSGQARQLYIDAAEKLGEYEQGKVLTALVKNERRR